MKWVKKGVIYKPTGDLWWAKSHAMIPTPMVLNESTIRIYITCRDKNNIGRIGYIDVNADNPSNIQKISKEPVLDIGLPGTFDDNGVLVTCIVEVSDKMKYLYYAGFELGYNIRYRLLTGLALSKDGGEMFKRLQNNAILERSNSELYFRGGPFVRLERGAFKLWYVAGSDWVNIGGKKFPVYEIKYLESGDGVQWDVEGTVCINIEKTDEHGFGRPYVIHQDGLYKMFYSIRRISLGEYRLGYAESVDGINWTRKDEEVGLDVSISGWDSEAIMYMAVIGVKGKTYAFYNGNEFGKTGFGYAVLLEW